MKRRRLLNGCCNKGETDKIVLEKRPGMELAGLLFLRILRIIMAIANEPRYNGRKYGI